MGWVTPHGSDRPVRRPDADPTAGRRPSTEEELDAALPGRKAARDIAQRDQAAFDRETVEITVGQLLKQGHTPERAKTIATIAARRAGGDAVPYRPPGPPPDERS